MEWCQLGYPFVSPQIINAEIEKNKIVAEMIIWFIDFSRGLKNNDQPYINHLEVVDLQS
jgi:hypothetical protein